jgi:hypothetical protein
MMSSSLQGSITIIRPSAKSQLLNADFGIGVVPSLVKLPIAIIQSIQV